VMRYRCVAARKAEGFNVVDACAAAGVSRSAFYALGQGEGPTERERDEALLIDQIRELHTASNGTYCEPRMTAELADKGWVLNRKRTARLMRQGGLQGHRPRRRRSLTKPDEDAPPIPDLVGRRFQPELLDTVWCGDLTYIRTGEGWLYLATVIDLASRRLIGWSMGTRHDAHLVIDALKMAVATRGRRTMAGTIIHDDPLNPVSTPPARSGPPAATSGSPSRPGGPGRASTTPWPSRSSPR
jgi:putative transposase